MRNFTKLTSLFMALIILLSCVSLPAVAKDRDQGTSAESSYAKKKVVSILYDDSSSMRELMSNKDNSMRYQHSEYALRMLMALLGTNDELMIMPMSHHNKACTCSGTCYGECRGFSINLADPNREGRIGAFFDELYAGKTKYDVYGGMTPEKSVEKALEKLNLQIAKNEYDNESTEFWFIILSDGAFNSALSTDQVVKNAIKDQPMLRTIYLGFGKDAPDLSGVSLGDNINFSGHKAITGDDLVVAMQDIANQLSGRFEYENKNGNYKVSGNTLTVDLSNTEYAVASLAVIVQDCGAKLVSSNYSKGQITMSQNSEIEADTAIGIMNGYSVIVRGDSSAPYMQGGQITLKYDKDISIDDVTILMEPAIYLRVKVEGQDENGGWVRLTRQDINSKMKQDDLIRVGYEVYDMVKHEVIPSDKIESLFGNSDESLSYTGSSGGALSMNQTFGLTTGNHTISVSVSFLEGKYTLRDSFACNVLEDPTSFRIELIDPIHNIEHGERTASTTYKAYYNGSILSKSELERNFKVTAEANGPGGVSAPAELKISNDGLIEIQVDVTNGLPTGDYEVYLKIILLEDDGAGNKVEADIYRDNLQAFEYTDVDVDLNFGVDGSDGSLSLEMTEYELEHNLPNVTDDLKKFIITLGSAGSNIVISPSDITIKAVIDGTDVSQYVEFDGTSITYAPYVTHFTTSGDEVVTKNITFEISSARYPYINGKTVSGTLVINKTYYDIISFTNGNSKVDRFDINGSNVTLYFRISRDGKTLSLEETQSALDSGLLDISIPGVFGFISPAGIETTVEMIDEEATVCCRVKKDWLPGLSGVASMFIFNGDRTVSATFRGNEAASTVEFNGSGAWEYIWRVLVIIFIIHCVFYTLGFFNGQCKNIPSGYFVYADVSEGNESKLKIMPVNTKFSERALWHIVRFLPIPRKDRPFYYYNQPVPSGNRFYDFIFSQGRNFSYIFKNKYVVYPLTMQNQSAAGIKFGKFRRELLENGSAKPLKLTYGEMRGFLVQTGRPPINQGTESPCSACYGFYDKETKSLKRVIFFVPKN